MADARRRRVVIFDLGGVVLDSPIMSIRRFSQERGMKDLNRFLGGSSAWGKLERSEIKPADFPRAVWEESKAANFEDGSKLGVEGWAELLAIVGGHHMRLTMATAIRRLREAGFTVAALTNNFVSPTPSDPIAAAEAREEQRALQSLFHHFIESSVVGLRKPDPRFYEHALKIVGCEAKDAIFLDDIGKNLKTAKDLGIRTIHVKNETQLMHVEAIKELESLVGTQLLDQSKL